MRVVIRFSLNKDKGSRLRRILKNTLEKRKIFWTGSTTATYEGYVSEKSVHRAMRAFWQEIRRNKTAAHLDHFWMYSDRTEEPIIKAPK